MSRVLRSLALASAILLLLAGGSHAQSDDEAHATDFDGVLRWPEVPDAPEGAPNARLAIYFDLVSRTRTIHAEPNTPFHFYLVAHNPHMGILSWETRVEVSEGLHIVGEELEGLRVGGEGEYIVSTLPQDCQVGDQVVLVKFTGLVLEEGLNDLAIRIAPIARSTLTDPPVPCYVVCRPSKEIRPFDHDELPAVVNPVELRIDDRQKPDFLKPVRGRPD
jgi:hypothetical protein